jgi:hypothetical protein
MNGLLDPLEPPGSAIARLAAAGRAARPSPQSLAQPHASRDLPEARRRGPVDSFFEEGTLPHG